MTFIPGKDIRYLGTDNVISFTGEQIDDIRKIIAAHGNRNGQFGPRKKHAAPREIQRFLNVIAEDIRELETDWFSDYPNKYVQVGARSINSALEHVGEQGESPLQALLDGVDCYLHGLGLRDTRIRLVRDLLAQISETTIKVESVSGFPETQALQPPNVASEREAFISKKVDHRFLDHRKEFNRFLETALRDGTLNRQNISVSQTSPLGLEAAYENFRYLVVGDVLNVEGPTMSKVYGMGFDQKLAKCEFLEALREDNVWVPQYPWRLQMADSGGYAESFFDRLSHSLDVFSEGQSSDDAAPLAETSSEEKRSWRGWFRRKSLPNQ
jgi:hypothetical protein